MQKSISIITAVLIFVCLSTVPAHADRRTMEGVLIGAGVAILGTAIIQGIHQNSHSQYMPYTQNYPVYETNTYTGYNYGYQNRHHNRRHVNNSWKKRPRGHWEIEKIWIEPVYETKWNPGHYNRRGKWKNGRYEKYIVTKECWQEDKVWVWH